MKESLGRYILRGELGRGAMSVIYRGYDPRIRRILAIKTLRPEYAEHEAHRYRFLSEARAAGTLTHPGIITIFDVGITNGVPFIAMELLEGPTLETYVERHGPLPLRTVLKIAMQIADALDYAHRQGVVHQDIKPENIAVIGDGGNIKVMDFGIARLRHEPAEDGIDAPAAAGTPHYMAPEQIRGGQIDGRCDLYALGVLLYWLLAGHPPFQTSNVNELLRRILNDPLPPLKPKQADVPESLLELVSVLLARDPEQRYQSGSELIDDLRRIDELLAERESAWGGRRIVPLRMRWTAVMSALVAVTVTAGLGVVYHKQNEAMKNVAFDYGLSLTQVLAVESAENLLLDDHIAIQALVDQMATNREIVHLTVSDRGGRVVASSATALPAEADHNPADGARSVLQRGAQQVYAATDAGGQPFYLFDTPVLYQQHELGRLRVGLSTQALQAANRTTLAAMIAVLLVTLVTVFIGAYMLSRRLAIPINILRRALGRITQGRFDSRIRMHRNDEFERLFAAYNAMADSLEARMFTTHSAKRNVPGESPQAAEATRLVTLPGARKNRRQPAAREQ